MRRPKGGNVSDEWMVTVGFRADPTTRDALMAIAQSEERGISAVVRDLVLDALQRREEAQAAEATTVAPSLQQPGRGATKSVAKRAPQTQTATATAAASA